MPSMGPRSSSGIPIVVKMAEMAVKLRRLAGLGVSRVSDYVQPPIEILERVPDPSQGVVREKASERTFPVIENAANLCCDLR
mgnify:CR=1 FL=1